MYGAGDWKKQNEWLIVNIVLISYTFAYKGYIRLIRLRKWVGAEVKKVLNKNKRNEKQGYHKTSYDYLRGSSCGRGK